MVRYDQRVSDRVFPLQSHPPFYRLVHPPSHNPPGNLRIPPPSRDLLSVVATTLQTHWHSPSEIGCIHYFNNRVSRIQSLEVTLFIYMYFIGCHVYNFNHILNLIHFEYALLYSLVFTPNS